MAEIKEQSGITPQQYAQFLPKQKYNIPKSTLQKVKSVITSLNSGIVTKSFSNTASTPFDFVINANNMSVIDLAQCYFNIAGLLEIPNGIQCTNEELIFGNLFISSLFQNATLDIGGATIAENRYPGLDANMQAMLKFDQNDLKNFALSDRQFMINGIKNVLSYKQETITFPTGAFLCKKGNGNVVPTGKTAAPLVQYAGKTFIYYNATPYTVMTGITANTFTIRFSDTGDGVIQFYQPVEGGAVTEGPATGINNVELNYYVKGLDDEVENINKNSIIPTVNDNGYIQNSDGKVLIPFRCKLYLSDLFNYTVDSLDYVFNRDIKITIQRSSINNIILNLSHAAGTQLNTVVNVVETTKFELICFSYLLTDTARNQLISYYSKPVDTLFGVETVNLTPLYSAHPGTEQNITLPLTVSYDTKAIILALPKMPNALSPLSTGLGNLITGKIETTAATNQFQTSWLFSNSNSYNTAGIKNIRISNTNNASIYYYDFAGTQFSCANMDALLKSFDWKNEAIDSHNAVNDDYREPYEQYKQLRLLFGKAPDNGIDYYTFIKDYFIIPIDLTGSNIPPNTRIFVTIQFETFGDKGTTASYNPLYVGNNTMNNVGTSNLMAIFLGSDVLTYNPDGTCVVKHVLSANPQNTVGYTIN